MSKFNVPSKKQVRVIINTDAKNEADDQYAIVHGLLTPKFQVKGLIGAHYGELKCKDSMQQSYNECQKVLSIMNLSDSVKVFRGAEKAITAEGKYEYSEGADLIVREALSDDPLPLFVVFLGPITDLACAYLQHPEIAGRLTAIWIGGGKYPEGGKEYNLSNDINAANIVFQSPIELWQVPIDVYSKVQVSLTELEMKVSIHGEIGSYLFRQMVELNGALGSLMHWPSGESWCLGDSPAIGLIIESMRFRSNIMEAPSVDEEMNYHFSGSGRKIRVYHDIDSRFILEDFYAKLAKYANGL